MYNRATTTQARHYHQFRVLFYSNDGRHFATLLESARNMTEAAEQAECRLIAEYLAQSLPLPPYGPCQVERIH